MPLPDYVSAPRIRSDPVSRLLNPLTTLIPLDIVPDRIAQFIACELEMSHHELAIDTVCNGVLEQSEPQERADDTQRITNLVQDQAGEFMQERDGLARGISDDVEIGIAARMS